MESPFDTSRQASLVGLGSPAGFTLVEVIIVIALVGLLAGLALTRYQSYLEKARIARAVAEIASLARLIDGLSAVHDLPPPDTLSGVDADTRDPWGNPYQYLRIEGMGFVAIPSDLPPVAAPAEGGGPAPKPRRDRFLQPLNTDYDLYSMGPDGESKPSLSALVSRDDVVRALNGDYLGVAERF